MKLRNLVIAVLFGLSALLACRPVEAQALSPRDVFVDCEDVCPQMVVIPAGDHLYGPTTNTDGSFRRRSPVTFDHQFAIGRFELTFEEWDACVADGGCSAGAAAQTGPAFDRCRESGKCSSNPGALAGLVAFDEGWGRGRRPLINVSPSDIGLYLEWLSARTGRTYRLLTAAEWAYASGGLEPLAGPMERISTQANIDQVVGRTLPVGAYAPNQFGLYDMIGNVIERVVGCGNGDEAPSSGSGIDAAFCPLRLVVGGSWRDSPEDIVPLYNRAWRSGTVRNWYEGFRVARDL